MINLRDSKLLITHHEDFVAPYIYDVFEEIIDDTTTIVTDVDAKDINAVVYCDCSAPTARSTFNADKALAAVSQLTEALSDNPPRAMVYISSVDVYGATKGEDLDENTPCQPTTTYGIAKLAVEDYLKEWAAGHGINLAILRPAMIIATGMEGEPRQLVNRIWRGTYRHIAGNEARLSAVHATTLAATALAVMGHNGTWNVTDGQNPTRHNLTEALAWRLDDKRIYSLPEKKARLLARIGDYLPITGFNTQSLEHQLTTLTFSSQLLCETMHIVPTPVVHYLRNHVYDESSR